MFTIEFKRSNLLLNVAIWSSLAQFVAAVVISMQLFESGNQPYRLSQHFLSDLGATKSPSCVLFNFSVFVLGAAVTAFFLCGSLDMQIDDADVRSFFTRLLRCCGVISGCGLMGVGLTPYDKLYGWHMLALVMWLLPMLVLLVSYVFLGPNTSMGRFTRLIATMTIIALGFYAMAPGRSGYIVMQKATVSTGLLWFLMIASPVSPVVRSTVRIHVWTEYRQRMEDSAADYLDQLNSEGHRLPTRPPPPPK